ncbi:hypothetical protein [Chryseobacterium indologenes]|nr:hypothetical protein [Chryseobacterium indologenes]
MKKTYIYAAVLSFLCGTVFGQGTNVQGVNFGNTQNPVPSLASIAKLNDNPPSLASGIPEISLPLVSISGYGGTELNMPLSYDPTFSSNDPVGETGAGWYMSKGGVISRQINGVLDETYQNSADPDYQKNIFDDEYYYSIPGFSGKFKIDRNIEQNTFTLIDLSPLNHLKISYTRKNNPATLIIDSFTITDDQGNTYYFNDSSIAVFYDSDGIDYTEFNSAFYLTRITNASGVETANFIYNKKAKYAANNTTLEYKTCQLEKVNTSTGNIEIVYDYDEALEKTLNDPYSIKKVILGNKYTKTAEYAFEYSYPFAQGSVESTSKRRQLDKIKKITGQTILEETIFLYHPLNSNYPTGLSCGASQEVKPGGILNKIIYPTKGATEYVYETNEVYKDRSSPGYLESIADDFKDGCAQYVKEYPSFDFDTTQSLTYTFTVSGDPSRKKTFWFQYGIEYNLIPGPIDPNTGNPTMPQPVNENQKMSYTLKRGNEVIASNQKKGEVKYFNYPGQYTVTITIPYVHGGKGTFSLKELMFKPGPFRNSTPAGKYRVKFINRYTDAGNTNPLQKIAYSYESFTLSNSSSGTFTPLGDVLYRNVKITEDMGKGHTQYHFKTLGDYPTSTSIKDGMTVTLRPYYNLVKPGVLEKKEVYSDNNQLLAKEEYQYTFTEADDKIYHIMGSPEYSKTAFTSQTKTNSIIYPSGSVSLFLQTQSENNVRADNFKASTSKIIAPDGTITETFYKYAKDKNNTRLLAANMSGVLMESEIKENGDLIGKTETRFDDSAHLYPSSVQEYNMETQNPEVVSVFSLYDNKGNLVQSTGKNGIPSTTIWGYYQTLPIAVIPGASYSQLASLPSITAAISASNADYDNPDKESELLQALDTLKKDPALKTFSITTSTYDPLIGITNSTSANGIRTVNVYDSAGRLVKIKTSEGKILQENEYNYKH